MLKRLALAALLLMTTGIALAQAPAPPQKVYAIRTTVAAEHASSWMRAVAKTVEAHAGHEQGNYWAAYQTVTGGPDLEFVFLFPFDKFAELDGWKSTRRILVEALGEGIGKQVAGVLDLSSDSYDHVITYVAELSHPRDPVRVAPPAFIWEYNTHVAEGKLTEYAALMRRVIKAHAESAKGVHWIAYGNALGGDREQIVYLMALDRFADLDTLPAPGSILAEVYGERDAARIGEAIGAISKTTQRIWRLRPAMSRLPQ